MYRLHDWMRSLWSQKLKYLLSMPFSPSSIYWYMRGILSCWMEGWLHWYKVRAIWLASSNIFPILPPNFACIRYIFCWKIQFKEFVRIAQTSFIILCIDKPRRCASNVGSNTFYVDIWINMDACCPWYCSYCKLLHKLLI